MVRLLTSHKSSQWLDLRHSNPSCGNGVALMLASYVQSNITLKHVKLFSHTLNCNILQSVTLKLKYEPLVVFNFYSGGRVLSLKSHKTPI